MISHYHDLHVEGMLVPLRLLQKYSKLVSFGLHCLRMKTTMPAHVIVANGRETFLARMRCHHQVPSKLLTPIDGNLRPPITTSSVATSLPLLRSLFQSLALLFLFSLLTSTTTTQIHNPTPAGDLRAQLSNCQCFHDPVCPFSSPFFLPLSLCPPMRQNPFGVPKFDPIVNLEAKLCNWVCIWLIQAFLKEI